MAQPCAKPACGAEPEVEPIFRCMFVVARFAVAAGVCRQRAVCCLSLFFKRQVPDLEAPTLSVSICICPCLSAVAAAVAVAFPSVGAAGDMHLC